MAKLNEELMGKARQANSVEELLALAKDNDVELTKEQAAAYFEQIKKSGELADEELEAVAGGGPAPKELGEGARYHASFRNTLRQLPNRK